MFKESEALSSAVEAVLAATENLRRGDVIPLELIEKVTRCRRYEGDWKSIVEKLKRAYQITRGITLWSKAPNEGYSLLTVEEQLHFEPMKRRRKAGRQMTLSLRSLGSLRDHAHLSERQAVALHYQEGHQKALRSQTRRVNREAGLMTSTPRVPVDRPA